MSMGWVAVDLDGTLARYDPGGYSHDTIGEPVPVMLERVKAWLAAGKDVRIFTARVAHDKDGEAGRLIKAWCKRHLGVELHVTCQKDYAMLELWDDRAIQVEMNTGRAIGYSTRGNS